LLSESKNFQFIIISLNSTNLGMSSWLLLRQLSGVSSVTSGKLDFTDKIFICCPNYISSDQGFTEGMCGLFPIPVFAK